MLQKLRTSKKTSSIFCLILGVMSTCLVIGLWNHFGESYPSIPSRTYSASSMPYLILPENVSSSPHPLNHLKEGDFSRLIDLNHFSFLMNQSCAGQGPLVLVLVHSHPQNYELRRIIRSTWGSVKTSQFKLLFLVGIPSNENIQDSLILENRINNDLIQGNFIDAYKNMTYKHVMALKWSIYFCPNAKYILKSDDDVFVNTPALLKYIHSYLSPYGARKLILCSLQMNSIPVSRSHRSKWRVSFSDYSSDYYPPYCLGYVILYSPDAAFSLYAEAQSSPYFWVDDVHITGLMALKAKISLFSLNDVILSRTEFSDIINNKTTANNLFLFGPYNLYSEQIQRMWVALYNGPNNYMRRMKFEERWKRSSGSKSRI